MKISTNIIRPNLLLPDSTVLLHHNPTCKKMHTEKE